MYTYELSYIHITGNNSLYLCTKDYYIYVVISSVDS